MFSIVPKHEISEIVARYEMAKARLKVIVAYGESALKELDDLKLHDFLKLAGVDHAPDPAPGARDRETMPARRRKPRFQLMNNRLLPGESPYSRTGFSLLRACRIACS